MVGINQKNAIKYKTKIIPIDSEHFSLWKLWKIKKLVMLKNLPYCIRGPFLKYDISKLKKVKPHQAIKHPKWKMGKKYQSTSATLMNKMLELVEAQKLFSIKPKNIEILIHPNL